MTSLNAQLYALDIVNIQKLKIAYTPRGNFSLRDFHHAVNNLPNDAFLPEFTDSGALCCDGNTCIYNILLWPMIKQLINRQVYV